jgi:hypothetical protein
MSFWNKLLSGKDHSTVKPSRPESPASYAKVLQCRQELLDIAISLQKSLSASPGSDTSARIAEARLILESCRCRTEVIAGLNRIGRSGSDIAPLVDRTATHLEQDASLDGLSQRDDMVAILTGLLVKRQTLPNSPQQ